MKKVLPLFWLILIVFLVKTPVQATPTSSISDHYNSHYTYIGIGAMIALIKVDTPPKPNTKGKMPPPLPEKRTDQKGNKIKKAVETNQYDKLPPPLNRTSSNSSTGSNGGGAAAAAGGSKSNASTTSGIYGAFPPEKKSSTSSIYGAGPPIKAPKPLPKIPVTKNSTSKPLPKTPAKAAKPLPTTPTKKASPKVIRRKKS